jgi:hypothetical protein
MENLHLLILQDLSVLNNQKVKDKWQNKQQISTNLYLH